MTSYRDAGVDLDAAEAAVDRIADKVTATWGDRVVGSFGGFSAGIRLPAGYRDPVLMMSTDGVGTKAEVARQTNLLDGLGWDLVAMCADDLAAAGARPLAMTDYLAVGRLVPERVERIVASVANACAEADIALIGGETAEHPGVMESDEFDLAGAVVGIVEATDAVDGSAIREGQAVIGLDSPNVRSNGFSLIRSAVLSRVGFDEPLTDGTVAEVLMAPSVLYSPAIMRVLDTVSIAGMAHITGGGIAANIARVLPPRVSVEIDKASLRTPPVFDEIAQIGNIAEAEMYRAFNMGLGFVVIVDPGDVAAALDALSIPAAVVGRTVAGDGTATLG